MLFKDSPPKCKALQIYYKILYLQAKLHQKLLMRMVSQRWYITEHLINLTLSIESG